MIVTLLDPDVLPDQYRGAVSYVVNDEMYRRMREHISHVAANMVLWKFARHGSFKGIVEGKRIEVERRVWVSVEPVKEFRSAT